MPKYSRSNYVHLAIRYSLCGNRAPAQQTRISRLKHRPNKNRASRARGPAADRN